MRTFLTSAFLLVCVSLTFGQTIPAGFQEYHVIGHEEHVWDMFQAVVAGEGSSCTFTPAQMSSIVALAASTDNQRVYYDHWEDGFESNILSPIQTTTLVLGDNNAGNGNTDNFTNDPRISTDTMLKGTNLKFNSDQSSGPADHLGVPIPRVATDFRYDGGDRLFTSGGPVALVHFQWPMNCELIGSSLEILSRQAVGNAYSYSVPVGTNTYTRYGGGNTPGEPFEYVYLNLVAFDDETDVFINNNGGGTASFTLNKGQHYNSQGAIDTAGGPAVVILEGTKISTSKPIAGMVYTAGGGTYQDRPFALMPDLMHSTDFMITAPGDDPAISRPLNLYIYNPDKNNTITVTATDSLGSASFTVPPNQVRAYSELAAMNRFVPNNSTARLTSSSNFWGFSAYDHTGVTVDWGHSWLATRFLTSYYSVPYSPGTEDPAGSYATRGALGCDGVTACNSENRSPLFISAVQNNTRVQIDLDNNGTPDMIDTNSDDVPDAPTDPLTNTYILDALQSLRVFDHTDYDNMGTQINTNKNVAVAFGQDTDQGVTSDDTLDLGHMIYPLDQRWLEPVLTIDKVGIPGFVPLDGGTVIYLLTVRTYGFGPMTDLLVYDLLPAGASYVDDSTVITYPGSSQTFNDPSITGNRLDWGLVPDTMNQYEMLTVQYSVSFGASAVPRVFRNESHVDATLGIGSLFSATGFFNVVQTAIDFSITVSSPTAVTGQTLTYTINVHNGGNTSETDVVISDPIPTGTTFSGSITSDNPNFTGVYDSAQNAVVWTAASFAANTSAVLTFAVTVNSDLLGGDVIRNRADYESDETLNFKSAEVVTLIQGPILSFEKSGPSNASPGDILTYSIDITNSGTGPATNVVIADTIPANSTYITESMDYRLDSGLYIALTDNNTGDDPGYKFATHVEFRLPSLAAGSTVRFRFRVTANSSLAAFINNFASVSCAQFSVDDTNLVQTAILNASAFTPPPLVNSPIYAGANSIPGTSPSPDGTIIRVYVNGVFVGQTTVSGGTWTLNGVAALIAGDEITADATEAGKATSNLSPPVIVSPVALATPAPAVNSPLYDEDTVITGTSISPDGTLIDVFVNGVWVGQTTVVGGQWALTNIAPLQTGQVVRATATETSKGTSAFSAPVTVIALPAIIKDSNANGMPIAPGQTLSYTIKVTNNSAQPWTNITVTDPLPAGTTYVASSTVITAPGTIINTYRDELSNVAYNGSNGTLAWTTSWTEVNDDNNVSNGDVNVITDLSDNSIHIQDDDRGIRRLANLSGYSSATLSFNYRRDDLESGESINLQISTGAGFTTIASFSGPADDSGYLSYSIDISSYISATTTIQFITPDGDMGDGDDFFLDNVQILLQSSGTQTNAGCAPPTLVGASGCNGYNLQMGETMIITYKVTVDNPVPPGTTEITNTASFTSDQVTSPVSGSVTDYLGGIPDLLRNDQVSSLSTYVPTAVFPLDGFGPNVIPEEGEGALWQSNGSSDDDDFYKKAVASGWLDTDPTALNDASRPLIFYNLQCASCILKLKKQGTQIEITY